MMNATEPNYVKWLVVVMMMCLNLLFSASFAWKLRDKSSLNGFNGDSAHGIPFYFLWKMPRFLSGIFSIGSPPFNVSRNELVGLMPFRFTISTGIRMSSFSATDLRKLAYRLNLFAGFAEPWRNVTSCVVNFNWRHAMQSMLNLSRPFPAACATVMVKAVLQSSYFLVTLRSKPLSAGITKQLPFFVGVRPACVPIRFSEFICHAF